MAIKERDVVLMGKDGADQTIDLPVTRLGLVEDGAEVKAAPETGDFFPIIDRADGGQMKKIRLDGGAVGALTGAGLTATIGTVWTDDPDGGWVQKVAVSGLLERQVKIGPDYTGLSRAQAEQVRRDFAKVTRIGVEAGKLTVWCWYQKPAREIPISITM